LRWLKITLKLLRKEVLKFASNAEVLAICCMVEMQLHRGVENSKKPVFTPSNLLGISGYSVPTKP
jgi:hypothetical protein